MYKNIDSADKRGEKQHQPAIFPWGGSHLVSRDFY